MDDKFTPEECLILINTIRDNELLYNPAHKFYKSKANREIAWKEISATVGKTGTLCKKKWRHLRDHYIRGHLKRGNTIENWCYYKPLNFLEIVRVKRPQYNGNENEEEEEDDVFSETEEVQPKKPKIDMDHTYSLDNNNDIGLIPVKIIAEDAPEVERVNVEESDDTEEFMLEIAKRINQLPPSLKDVAKVNILAHITELELQHSAQFR